MEPAALFIAILVVIEHVADRDELVVLTTELLAKSSGVGGRARIAPTAVDVALPARGLRRLQVSVWTRFSLRRVPNDVNCDDALSAFVRYARGSIAIDWRQRTDDQVIAEVLAAVAARITVHFPGGAAASALLRVNGRTAAPAGSNLGHGAQQRLRLELSGTCPAVRTLADLAGRITDLANKRVSESRILAQIASDIRDAGTDDPWTEVASLVILRLIADGRKLGTVYTYLSTLKDLVQFFEDEGVDPAEVTSDMFWDYLDACGKPDDGQLTKRGAMWTDLMELMGKDGRASTVAPMQSRYLRVVDAAIIARARQVILDQEDLPAAVIKAALKQLDLLSGAPLRRGELIHAKRGDILVGPEPLLAVGPETGKRIKSMAGLRIIPLALDQDVVARIADDASGPEQYIFSSAVVAAAAYELVAVALSHAGPATPHSARSAYVSCVMGDFFLPGAARQQASDHTLRHAGHRVSLASGHGSHPITREAYYTRQDAERRAWAQLSIDAALDDGGTRHVHATDLLIARLAGVSEGAVRQRRHRLGLCQAALLASFDGGSEAGQPPSPGVVTVAPQLRERTSLGERHQRCTRYLVTRLSRASGGNDQETEMLTLAEKAAIDELFVLRKQSGWSWRCRLRRGEIDAVLPLAASFGERLAGMQWRKSEWAAVARAIRWIELPWVIQDLDHLRSLGSLTTVCGLVDPILVCRDDHARESLAAAAQSCGINRSETACHPDASPRFAEIMWSPRKADALSVGARPLTAAVALALLGVMALAGQTAS